MTYSEAADYLFNVAPLFQNIGQGAYKEGLSNTHTLDQHFGHPHRSYRTIHVAGTNGKGSVSHTLASILQQSGLRVGLYTSPHLIDFRERIKINGTMISEERVVRFIEEERSFFEPFYPSFFELATALAFLYFEEEKVDVAVVEVGLGGRLDCTNIITPDLSVITNISFDHTQFLGHTLKAIAGEKAGIIKDNIPVVIGETNGHSEVREVFFQTAASHQSPVIYAEESGAVVSSNATPDGRRNYVTTEYGILHGELGGLCQEKNTATILCAVEELRKTGYNITHQHVRNGVASVCETTGLMGRWQQLSKQPLTICDTGHNPGGIQYIAQQLAEVPYRHLHIVIGMVSDKDIAQSLSLFPKNATYYFTQASVKRAMQSTEFAKIAHSIGLNGKAFPAVIEAYQAAKKNASGNDMIFIGGSTFVVADLLTSMSF
ncbi:MAG: bifunctional folylpolyglutamate synthase/dihydrofolate synthase [Bacteroidaceae bacterium]|nr:bifunctional folylpolyglutamate synthase/dihydrofolate synthase [Bacteroidaceae bacterium]